MIPKSGDKVKLNSSFINDNPSFEVFRDKPVEVVKVRLTGINKLGASSYDIYVMDSTNLRKIGVDGEGCFKGLQVFEDMPDRLRATEDDVCKDCNVAGEIKGMCCVCPKCGQTIWGI